MRRQSASGTNRCLGPVPVMIDHGMRHLVLPTHPTAASNPNHRPARELRDLLLALEEENVHHRDVHPGNILSPRRVRLIDWECAVREYGPSYDLYGPRPDLGPPDIHDRFPPQWWNSEMSHRSSTPGVSLTDLQEIVEVPAPPGFRVRPPRSEDAAGRYSGDRRLPAWESDRKRRTLHLPGFRNPRRVLLSWLAEDFGASCTAVDDYEDWFLPGVTVINERLTADQLARLGSFDVVLGLSVLHHVLDWRRYLDAYSPPEPSFYRGGLSGEDLRRPAPMATARPSPPRWPTQGCYDMDSWLRGAAPAPLWVVD